MKLSFQKMKSKQAALEVQQVKSVAILAHLQIQYLKAATVKFAFLIQGLETALLTLEWRSHSG